MRLRTRHHRRLPFTLVLATLALGVPTTLARAAGTEVEVTSGPSGTIASSTATFAFSYPGATNYLCAMDVVFELKKCNSPFTAEGLLNGPHTFYVLASDTATKATSKLTKRTFTVEVPGGQTEKRIPLGGGGPIVPGAPTIKPAVASPPLLSGVSQSRSRWREGSALARLSAAKPPLGTTFSFSLSEPATVSLAFSRSVTGRVVNGRCVAQTRHNLRKGPCARTLSAGSISLSAKAAVNHLRFQGRLSARSRLAPGRYRVTLSASAGGLTSVPRSLSFTIVG